MKKLDFTWKHHQDVWQVHIFNVLDFSGTLTETEEMKPQWFDIEKIPFETMWPDDVFWFPLFLAGKKFKGTFLYDDEVIVEQKLYEVENI